MRITIVKADGSLLYEVPEHAQVRFHVGQGELAARLSGEGVEVREVQSGAIAVRPNSGNSLVLVSVRPENDLQPPRFADPSAVSRQLELLASNALHGFNKNASADARLKKLAADLDVVAAQIRLDTDTGE